MICGRSSVRGARSPKQSKSLSPGQVLVRSSLHREALNVSSARWLNSCERRSDCPSEPGMTSTKCPPWVKSRYMQKGITPKADSECPRVGGSLAVSAKIKVQLAGLMPLGVTYREITCDDKIKGRAKDIVA